MAVVFLSVLVSEIPDNYLHIIACDVGQGDAVLVTYKKIQILTDGGPNNKVIDCLSRYTPFWDREINLVVSTHPDADHSTGLVEVVKRYKVKNILINPIDSGTQTIRVLEKMVGSKGVGVLTPHEGQSIGVDLIHLDIFNPSVYQTSQLSEKAVQSDLNFYNPIEATNEYSITYKLSFKDFSGLFTGDFGPEVSERLSTENKIGQVNYIKVPHHGSKNGITESLIKNLMPKVGIISVGKNSYGHPSIDVVEMLERYKVKIYRTDIDGDVELVTDGVKLWFE